MKLKFLIVGSTLYSKEPEDLDLLAVMPKKAFEKEFMATWDELNKELKLQFSPLAESYLAKCRGATLILSQLFNKRHIDFKFVPDNAPYGNRKRIELLDLSSID